MWMCVKYPDVLNKMAAPCRRLVRSAIEAGLRHFSGANLCLKTARAQSLTCFRPQRCVLQHRALHGSSSRLLTSTRTGAGKTADPVNNTNDRETKEEQEEEHSGPEYIPKRKAKNPMKVIGYAWIIGLPAGIIGFILAKRQVDKNRLQQLKIRQRMKKSNEGEYDRERYKPAAGMQ